VELESLEEKYVEPVREIAEEKKKQLRKDYFDDEKWTDELRRWRELESELNRKIEASKSYFETVRQKGVAVNVEEIFAKWDELLRETCMFGTESVTYTFDFPKHKKAIVEILERKR
jgi:DNA-binding PadR family transcriptional regulator